MTSIALGLFILFMIYIVIWSVKNDQARSISDQTGLIRMREPARPNEGGPERSRGRVQAVMPSRSPIGRHDRR